MKIVIQVYMILYLTPKTIFDLHIIWVEKTEVNIEPLSTVIFFSGDQKGCLPFAVLECLMHWALS